VPEGRQRPPSAPPSSPSRLNQRPSGLGHSRRGPWTSRQGSYVMVGLKCPTLPALAARRAPVRRPGISVMLNIRPHNPLLTLGRPYVPRLLDAHTPARPSGIRPPALLSCCVRRRSRIPRTTACLGTTPRHRLAWGPAAKEPTHSSPSSTPTLATTSSLIYEVLTAGCLTSEAFPVPLGPPS